ncbi:hypothetical protein HY30_12325 [Hyphomonas chukchiensis]|uniref:Uncharacterized protein n=1 Tax=Hyphomonas chukchiensis TaxID=1280947 RepID=A0A062UQW0_9PROT|nr:hypothetical protein HY30_12325 [Hyphomonas chukchiensis]|tara:strand:- start:982 stop:1137 length:156 start_codon:yes stop_codon:yes gene_type:complete
MAGCSIGGSDQTGSGWGGGGVALASVAALSMSAVAAPIMVHFMIESPQLCD